MRDIAKPHDATHGDFWSIGRLGGTPPPRQKTPIDVATAEQVKQLGPRALETDRYNLEKTSHEHIMQWVYYLSS
jgi:hypothetical protein